MEDPRPELFADSVNWLKLLNRAESINPVLAWQLHGFRCCGLRLIKEDNRYILKPDLNPKTGAWTKIEQYNQDRDRFLVPFQKEIIDLLEWLDKQ